MKLFFAKSALDGATFVYHKKENLNAIKYSGRLLTQYLF